MCDSDGVDEDCDPCTVSGGAADGDQDADGYERATCTNPWLGASAPVGCNVRLVVDAMTRQVRGTDCNDAPARMGAQQNPGLPEVCSNMVDDNCNGAVDEAVMGTLYRDADNDRRGDRSGAAGSTMTGNVCVMMPQWVANNDDCDDTRSETYLGARELCDRRDNDCSLAGAMAGGAEPSEDSDNDGYSPPGATCVARGEPGALVGTFLKTDCDDARASANPGATEDLAVCDGVDNDCRATTSELTGACMGSGACLPGGVCGRGGSIVQIVAGFFHACARRSDGKVLCWGRNQDGELGLGNTTRQTSPMVVPLLSGVVELAAGERHTCARRNDGTVLCWGFNVEGQLGIGSTTSQSSPMVVPALTDVLELAAGGLHTCARRSDGTVRCWGINTDGHLGIGSTTNQSSPTAIAGFGNVVELAAGGFHTCALLSDRSVHCWGSSNFGQLGLGNTTNQRSPAIVATLSNVAAITAGEAHTCARLNDGTVRCWGWNPFGQLGTGNTTNQLIPTAVPMLSNVVDLVAGERHTCARLTDGTIRCWGSNAFGQLGVGNTTNQLSPTVVPMLSNVVDMVAGGNHTCVRLVDGSAATMRLAPVINAL